MMKASSARMWGTESSGGDDDDGDGGDDGDDTGEDDTSGGQDYYYLHALAQVRAQLCCYLRYFVNRNTTK